MSDIRKARQRRELNNQDDFRNITSCPASLSGDELNTTLVTQLDTQRLWLVNETCARWKDPLVIVVYFADESIHTDIAVSFREEIEADCPHVDLLFVVNDSEEETPYPINLLRNLALERVRTSHVLLTDADLLPSVELSKEINEALLLHQDARQKLGVPGDRDAMVVPAFQIEFPGESEQVEFLTNPQGMVHRIPRKFADLKGCINSTACTSFREKHFPNGHSSTRSHRWLQEDWYQEVGTVKDIKQVKCMKSDSYEPYLVLPWCSSGQGSAHRISPLYDERFLGCKYMLRLRQAQAVLYQHFLTL